MALDMELQWIKFFFEGKGDTCSRMRIRFPRLNQALMVV